MVVRPVGVHDPDLEGFRGVGVAREVLLVAREVLRCRGVVGPVDDPLAVVGEEGAAVVAGRVGHALHVRAVGVHRVELEVAVARGREDDRLAVGRDRGLGVVPGGREERLDVAAVRLGGVDVVVVEGPDVSVRPVRPRRARRARTERRRVENPVTRRKEVGAGRLALAVGDAVAVRAVGLHREDLVAGQRSLVGLEDEPGVVGRPVRLGVLAAEGQLPDVGEVFLLAGGEKARGGRWRRRGAGALGEGRSRGGGEQAGKQRVSHRAADVSRPGRPSVLVASPGGGLYSRSKLRWIVRPT